MHAVSGTSYAGFVSQLPGVYTTPPDPNVMFTLDDSGSMLSDAIPDIPGGNAAGMPTSGASNALGVNGATWPAMWKAGSDYLSTDYYRSTSAVARYLRSSSGNPLYYDPKVTYRPWPTAVDDRVLHANADPRAVNVHASDPFNSGYRLDLTTRVGSSGSSDEDDETRNFWLGTYYVYQGTNPLPLGNPNAADNTPANFTRYVIRPGVSFPRAATRSDCSGAIGSASGCTYAEELQNFANWLQYYHSRALMAKGAAAVAFSRQGSNLRVGLASLNFPGSVRRPPARFSGASRQGFYTEMYASVPSGGTPLRLALDNVGRYFQRTGAGNPWAEDPTAGSVGREYTCRRSFHILSTDGFWNGANATAPASGD
ncbi:MAG TPA: hypothetical protein VFX50_12650, partial [Gemmatimonadales bacterium]|nr:hypothetical protein [Gemmatimonadales bacterium]